jgi:hypothetical protein
VVILLCAVEASRRDSSRENERESDTHTTHIHIKILPEFHSFLINVHAIYRCSGQRNGFVNYQYTNITCYSQIK